ncbi:MAG: outer membrane lipoprotein carrier protein LolA [Ignavibacteriae bacterium]|nr:outer membrane lipoprotein carrier protein LolA [Ignavibacteriota bacterium]MCB9206823.1 outer membrane lipoprotein carrier protein LolA [Ignavibacteriales bacterium]MCB9210169.1 outer membrane lipoprotein carrier protein LolA [Ignavibacteriales bacterium]MCB9218446.1 outer membrane lipoprotein carrier protein LolA [Ignavibacteriales bacterium]MCB9259548.1 outer membrane lipoprotein carrier protein LolA [Ignavibacteriales bacterium]
MFLLFYFLLVIQSNGSAIDQLKEKFENINYLSADFSQNYNDENALKGKFYFKKQNNYRIELPSNIIISDGTSIWNNDTKRNRVVISNLDEDPLAFSLTEYIYDYPEKCNVKEEKNDDGYLLTLTAVNTELNFKTARLWVNNNYLIDKITVVDFGGNSFSLQFKNINVLDKIDDSYFEYKGDSKTKLIDLR